MPKFRVWVEQTAKGSWRVRVHDKHGKFSTPHCIEKAESATINGKLLVGKTLANAYAKQLEERNHKNELGDLTCAHENTEELLEEFVESRRIDQFALKTILHYEASFRCFLKDMQPGPFSDVTDDLLRGWKVLMTKRGNSVHTITNQLSDVRTWLNWLKERGKIKVSPFGPKMMPMKKELEKRFYTREQFMALDEALLKVDYPTRILCHLAHSATCRLTEGLGVCGEDITWLPKETYEINGETFTTHPADLLIRKEVAKGKKRSRVIPIDEGLIEVLGSRRLGNLVPGRNEWQIEHYFKRARKLAGLDGLKPALTIHGLRHTFAKNYLQSGEGNLASLQKLLGHSSIVSTMVYAQFEKAYLREGINRAYEKRKQEEGIIIRQKEA